MIGYLNKYLQVEHQQDRTNWDVIKWWEKRRILYNLIVLAFGLLSIAIIDSLIDVPPGEDIQEPITILFFGVLCNICYTLGWVIEIGNRDQPNCRPKYFKIGLGFTLFWVMLPAMIHVIWWIKRGFTIYQFK